MELIKDYLDLQRRLTDIEVKYPLTYTVFSNILRQWYSNPHLYRSGKRYMLTFSKFSKAIPIINKSLISLKRFSNYILLSPTILLFPIILNRLKNVCEHNQIGLIIYIDNPYQFFKLINFTRKHRCLFNGILLLKFNNLWDYNMISEFFLRLEIGDNEFDSIESQLDKKVKELVTDLSNFPITAFFSAGDSTYIDAMTILSLRILSIPSFVILHGYPQEPFDGVLPIAADHLLVWDDHIKQRLDELINSNNKTISFAYPKFDKIYLKNFQSEKKIKTNNLNILYASNPFEEDNRYESIGLELRNNMNSLLLKLSNNGYNLKIRPHPTERYTIFSKIPSQLHKCINKNPTYDTNSLLTDILNSDLVISFRTSVLYESMLLGIPTLNIILNDKNDLFYEYNDLIKIDYKELNNVNIIDIVENKCNQENQYLTYDFNKKLTELFGEYNLF